MIMIWVKIPRGLLIHGVVLAARSWYSLWWYVMNPTG